MNLPTPEFLQGWHYLHLIIGFPVGAILLAFIWYKTEITE